MVDKRGRVRHLNSAAEQLFATAGDTGSSNIDALLIFEPPSRAGLSGDLCWNDAFKDLRDQDGASQWDVKGVNQSNESEFSAKVNLAKIVSKDGQEYVIGYVQTDEVEHRAQQQRHQFDLSTEPMMAIDQTGIVLMFNHAAIDVVDWCKPELVGQHISLCLENIDFEDRTVPIMGVGEDGTIISVNAAAGDHLSWCSKDLIGLNLLKIGDNSEDKHKGDTRTESYTHLSSWFTSKKNVAHDKRRTSPEVLRIYILARERSFDSVPTASFAQLSTTGVDHQLKTSVMWAMVEASLDPMFEINEKGIIRMVNRAALRLFGYCREEFVGSNISMIVGGGHAANHDKYLKRYLESGITKVIGKKRVLSARRSDGTEFPIELGVAEVDTGHGEERLFCGFVHDLSSIKKKERMTNDIIEASLDPLFVIGESGIIRRVNHAAVSLFGYTEDEFVGHNISKIIGGDNAKHHDQFLHNYLASGREKVIGERRQLPARRKDGSELPIQLTVVEMKTSDDEERLFCGFMHDLSQIKSSESISIGIIESSLDAMFLIDDHGTIEMVNQAAVDIFGFDRDEFMVGNINMIIPIEDAAMHDHYLARFRETGKLNVVGRRRRVMARKKDGTDFYVEINIAPINDISSGTTKFCGFLRNLTHAEGQEQSLIKRERLLRGMIDASTSAMFQIDHTGQILTVNAAAVSVFGWTENEFLRGNISMIMGKDHAARHDEYLKRYLETGEKRAMGKERHLNARRKDGSEIEIELSLTEVITSEGRTFCGFLRDLSQINQQKDIATGLIDASLDPMFLIDSRGLILMVNQAACTHFGWDKDEFLNSNIKMIVGGDHAKSHDSYIQNYHKTGTSGVIGHRRVMPGRRKNGSEIPVELTVVEVKRATGSYFCGYARILNEDGGRSVSE